MSRFRPSGITWVGPGRTTFAIPAALGTVRKPVDLESLAAAPRLLGAAADSPRMRAIADHFSHGGGECVVLCDERLYDPTWIGEDGGAGRRSGAHALAEPEDVGTVVLLAPGPAAPPVRREEAVLVLADRRRDLLFVLEVGPERFAGSGATPPSGVPRSGRASSLLWLAENLLLVDSSRLSVGALTGAIEARDWREECPFHRRSSPLPAGLAPADLERLLAWRREQGLRRSLDWGTRWLLLEPSHPLVWRSVERSIRAFLARLEKYGFFEAPGVADLLEVECVPLENAEEESLVGSRVAVVVRPRRRAAGLDNLTLQ